MKKTFWIYTLFILSFLPIFSFAEESETEVVETEISTTTEGGVEADDASGVAEEKKAFLNIRYNDQVIYAGVADFSTEGVFTVTDNNNVARDVPKSSVLAVLGAIDQESDDFSITNLGYYESFDSFILNCLSFSVADEVNACDSWQYTVNGEYPFVGIDDYLLSENDVIYFYFGSPRRFDLGKSEVFSGESFVVHVDSYDYKNNLWLPLSGAMVGATLPNVDDPYNPLVPFSAETDESGDALFVIGEPKVYNIGLALDYYFPTKALTVVASSTTNTLPEESGTSSGGSDKQQNSNIKNALQFLSENENGGKIANDLITDWSAIAFGAQSDFRETKDHLKTYITTDKVSGSWLSDFVRRAMALMALGVSPYNGTSFDYVDYILNSFDGEQFGDGDIWNDDLFSLLVLLNAGYTYKDEVVGKIVGFILDKQSGDGSFIGPDMTSAVIQILSKVNEESNVEVALNKAVDYLRKNIKADGSFGDPFATSWAVQAISSLGEDPSLWTFNGENNSPVSYLESLSREDGGIGNASVVETQLWSTAYAVPALLEKTWHDILKNFSKPKSKMSSTDSSSSKSLRADKTSPKVLGVSTSAEDREALIRYIEIVLGLSRDTIIYIN